MGTLPAVVVTGWEAVNQSLLNEDLNGRPDLILNRDRNDGKRLGRVNPYCFYFILVYIGIVPSLVV